MVSIYYIHQGDKETPIYVGATSKTLKSRLLSHKNTSAWVKKLENSEALFIELIEVVSLKDAWDAEERWILYFQELGYALLNCKSHIPYTNTLRSTYDRGANAKYKIDYRIMLNKGTSDVVKKICQKENISPITYLSKIIEKDIQNKI